MTDTQATGAQFTGDFWRRLAVTIAAIVTYLLTLKLPHYGMDREQLIIASQSIGSLSRVSVGALGMIPMLSALSIYELARLVGLRSNHPNSLHRPVASWVLWLALFFATLQGGGVAMALEQISGGAPLVPEPGITFRLACVGSMVGATALFWWLADQIARNGLGSGFWVLLLVLFVMGFAASDVPLVIEAVRTGQTSAPMVAAVVAGMVGVVFIAVFLVEHVAGISRADVVVWPSLLVPQAINLMLLPIGALASLRGTGFPDRLIGLVTPTQPIGLVVTSSLIALVTYLAGRLRDDQMSAVQIRTVAFGLIAIMLAGNALQTLLPVSFTNGTMLIAATAVCLQILQLFRSAG